VFKEKKKEGTKQTFSLSLGKQIQQKAIRRKEKICLFVNVRGRKGGGTPELFLKATPNILCPHDLEKKKELLSTRGGQAALEGRALKSNDGPFGRRGRMERRVFYTRGKRGGKGTTYFGSSGIKRLLGGGSRFSSLL